MPHVRVDLHRALAPRVTELSAAIHASLVDGLDMPEDDLFQIFTLHDRGELVFTKTFPGADRDDIIFIQVLASLGYSSELKQRMYAAMVDNIVALGIRQDTVMISVVEVDGANWHAPGKPVDA
jgi:phenylpyruvate tautomerase PptA (4-oxalocrotonate tautomerase family)